MPCSDDPKQLCGGPERLTVYWRPASAGPKTNPGPNGLSLYQAITSTRPQPLPASSPSPSPEPPPSPSPQPGCAPMIQTDGQIGNGGFELGSTWTRGPSPNAASKEIFGLA
ncbi:uncharacterized protein yc1106_01389 [Curvularia clavata]|uniref:Uncharacterized protein n=1 Tax=Curvularia clavata TaxID=95742 RepID=A0A9Q8Z1T7_CURCL|nr:uncharacterized protein yc1106_01389 [Curvularia clavata]